MQANLKLNSEMAQDNRREKMWWLEQQQQRKTVMDIFVASISSKISERRSHTISHSGYSALIKFDRCWRKSMTV